MNIPVKFPSYCNLVLDYITYYTKVRIKTEYKHLCFYIICR